ncbi:hypothetical protein K523DRAFT_314244, partial [Schizophyllum commune Tattone D]
MPKVPRSKSKNAGKSRNSRRRSTRDVPARRRRRSCKDGRGCWAGVASGDRPGGAEGLR